MKPEIQITEEFDHPSGKFVNYDTIDPIAQEALDAKKHVDLRSFDPIAPGWAFNLADFGIAGLTTDDTNALIDAQPGAAGWTNGTLGKISSLNNRYGLIWPVTTGSNDTVTNNIPPDLGDFGSSDFISLSLPNFPASQINLASSHMTISDINDNAIQYNFTDSLVPLTNASCEARWANNLGSLKPFKVRLTIVATANTTVFVTALRILPPDWTPMNIDIDTRQQTLHPTVTRTGVIPASNPMPRAWRSDQPTRAADPRPFDAKLGVVLNTGSRLHSNFVTLYFRGRREDSLTQLDLDGSDTNSDGVVDIGYDMAGMNALGHQPDYGLAVYNAQPQSDLDLKTQGDINGTQQAYLERLADLISASWVEAKFSWSNTGATITIGNADTANIYSFDVTSSIASNTTYLFSVKLEDDAIRCRLYSLNVSGVINTLVYDTNRISDDFTFKRAKGRIGWQIDLQDGDATVRNIRSQELMYGEFISHALESVTPVVGARLTVAGSSDRELYTGAESWNNSVIGIDNSISNSPDGSYKITGTRLMGIQSTPINIDNFAHTKIKFDVYLPRSLTLYAALVNEHNYFLPLNIVAILPNKWSTVSVVPRVAANEQTGQYRLALFSFSVMPATFWIDNISVKQEMIAWAARSATADPWGQFDPAWTEFRDLLNTDDGVLFHDRGTSAQVRGQALSQNVVIDKVFLRPKYAELGRLVWEVPGRDFYDV